MHIAMLSGEYPPRWGGMGSVVFHLASHLAERGHRITVITRKHGDAGSNSKLIPSKKSIAKAIRALNPKVKKPGD